MTDLTENHFEGTGDMDDVGKLIHHAGAREPVDAERMENARQRVVAHWESTVSQSVASKKRNNVRWIAVAASLISTIGISFFYLQPSNQPYSTAMATVDRVIGNVVVANATAVQGAAISEDTLIETSEGDLIALRLRGGQSLRIDQSSQLVVHSPNHVSLARGASTLR